METVQIEANEISQHPDIIRGAQKEIVKQDVLVCGGCHAVFHYVEDFSIHKEKACSAESHLKDCREVKAKVWAFLLWKGAQVGYDSTSINSWQLYQEWVKMDPDLRETWVVAGKNVQTFAKMGHGGVQELPIKSNKANTNINDKKQTPGKAAKNSMVNELAQRGIEVRTLQHTSNKKDEDKDWSGESEVESDEDKSKNSKASKKESDKENNVSTTVPHLPAIEIKTVKKDFSKDLKDPSMRIAVRTCKASDADRGLPTGEYTVEKILAKRFNPRRKQHEYLLKWEGYSHENNTWEPAEHMNSCRNLLEQFEKQLAKQKEQRAAAAQRALQLANQQNSAEKNKNSTTAITPVNSSGRPQRNSKVKAMDHMKQWVGHINDDSDSGTLKRRADSDSESEASEKKIKIDSQQNKVTKPQSPVKIVPVTKSVNDSYTMKSINGLSSKNDTKGVELESPEASKPPIIVSNARGVVKVDPKQLPNLSSGVYIMSKNSGIIKIDSAPSPGGVVLVKDGKKHPTISPIRSVKKPKSEAHVKVIQEGENLQSGIVRVNNQSVNKIQPKVLNHQVMKVQNVPKGPIKSQPVIAKPNVVPQAMKTSPAKVNQSTPMNQLQRTTVTPGRIYARPKGKISTPDQRGVGVLKNPDSILNTPQEQPKTSLGNKSLIPDKMDSDDDDSDALDLFPADLPPPEPSSPPRPLTLCPITGKVLGQAEGEPTPEPSPEPSTEPNDTLNISTPSDSLLNVQMSSGKTGTLISSSNGSEKTTIKLTDSTVSHPEVPITRKLFSTTSDGTAVAEEEQDNNGTLMITGEDGTIYQVAGEDADGQTILVTHGADGKQKCVYVTSSEQDGSLTLDTAVAEAVANMLPSQTSEGESQQYYLKENEDDDSNTLPTEELMVQTNVGGVTDDNDGQVVAEVVQADLPSPGGTRRVVLLLPDGNFMMTEVDEEQFAALNLSS